MHRQPPLTAHNQERKSIPDFHPPALASHGSVPFSHLVTNFTEKKNRVVIKIGIAMPIAFILPCR